MNFKSKVATFLGALLLFPLSASADFSFEGYLAYTNGTPVSGNATISLKVLSPGSEACILYSEDHTVTLPADGYAALSMGSGTRTDGLPHTLAKAFENSGTFSGLSCSSGTTYTPANGDKRKLKVVVNTGTPETLGTIDINPVPAAVSAGNVGGFAPNQLLRGEIGGVPAAVSAFTPTQVLELGYLSNGTSSLYMRNNFSQGATLPSMSGAPGTPIAGSIWYDTTSNQVKYYNGSTSQALSAGGGGTVTSVTSANSDLYVTNPATTPVLTLNTGTGANQIVKLTGGGQYPAVDGSLITNLNAASFTIGTIPVLRGGTGVSSFVANSVVVANGTGTSLTSLSCTLGQVITFDASGYAVCGLPPGFMNNGNNFGATASLGTNDSYPLKFRTGGTDKVAITPSGDVGIGTLSPAARLQVQGQIVASEAIIPSGGIVNFASGNTAVLQSVGGASITLNGLIPGGKYTVIVEDPTARTYTFTGCTNKFSPANTVTTTSTRTIYEIYYSGSGSTCYIHMIPGYQ